MKFMSLFSGIEAVSAATKSLDWEPVAFSEIADFPSAVLEYRFPEVPNLGDVKKIDGEKYSGTVDVVVGGSPCQGFSVSGYRRGLYDERSVLAREFYRILSEIRPRWFIWENVPGCLSTNRGQDFRELLFEMGKLGYGLSWRILDSQFFGVPQKRRRVFIIGYYGDWRPSAAVLFEQKGLSGSVKTSKGKKQRIAPSIARDIRETELKNYTFDVIHDSECRIYKNITPTLCSYMGRGGNNVPLTFSCSSFSEIKQSDIGSTLRASGGNYAGGSENYIYDGFLRKLTPLECERLQGFPDNWTDIPYKGKQHSPLSKRYEAIGNSMAVPVMKWICERISKADNIIKGQNR